MKIKKKILIVEDDIGVGMLLERILGKKYNVSVVEDGLLAMRWLQNEIPDLIISDIRMPNLDGLQLIESLHKSGLYRDVPIIILSGDVTVSDLPNLDYYVVGCFQKPFNPSILLKSVDKVFEANLYH